MDRVVEDMYPFIRQMEQFTQRVAWWLKQTSFGIRAACRRRCIRIIESNPNWAKQAWDTTDGTQVKSGARMEV